jgi:hypothetical protein
MYQRSVPPWWKLQVMQPHSLIDSNKQLQQGQDQWCADITHNQLQSWQLFISFMELQGKSVETF